MIEQAVEEIKSVLKMGFPTFQVDDYPEDIKKYTFSSPRGCLLVRYDTSTFSAPGVTDLIEQTETMEFPIFFSLRYAHSFKDTYGFLTTLKDVLTGLRIGSGKLYPKKRTYVAKINGDIWWSFLFCLDVKADQTQNIPSWG